MPLLRLSLFATAFLIASCPIVTAQTYQWSAFAGLPPQYGYADGKGTEARFNLPYGIASTAEGEIFVCDYNNNTIRRIDASGTVTTFVGSPFQGGAVDGTRSAARFYSPSGIAIAGGFYYVTDRFSHTIRRISGSGEVTTFAGRPGVSGAVDGTAAEARFNGPTAISADSNGNLYVADMDNHVIRKITPTGEVTTFVGLAGSPGNADGTGAGARFNRPTGLYISSTGVLYVADTYNHTVRRVTSTGVVTTVAGSPGLSGASNGAGSVARFRYPRGILAYADGTVIVVDAAHALRSIDANGVVTTYAGRLDVEGSRDGARTDARFYLPMGLTFGSGGIVVSDYQNGSIRKIDTVTGSVSTFAGSPGNFGRQDGLGAEARFNYPNGVAVHSSGDIYLADSRGNTIRRISSTGQVTQVAGAAAGGDAYVDGPAAVQSLNYPVGVAVAEDRTVYFCEYQRHTIRVLRPDGSVATLAGREGVAGSTDGAGEVARFYYPTDLALDRDGNLYVADFGNSTIRRIATGTGAVTTFAGAALAAGAIDGAGSVARFRGPRGVATDTEGNIYVADANNHMIRRISRAGDVSTIVGTAGVSGTADGVGAAARFNFPTGVAVDGKGVLFITDGTNATIRRCVGTAVTTIGGTAGYPKFYDGVGTSTLFSIPSGIAVDDAGNLYVSEAGNSIVRRGQPLTAPTIQAQPQAAAAIAGGSATFSVSATGGGLSYQWRLGGVAIPGATGATYTARAVTLGMAGNYTVTVGNALGVVTSQPAALTLVAPADAGRITNLSILTSLAEPGDSFTMGFVVGGAGTVGTKPLVVRAAGPSLGALGVPGTVDDPKLDLFFGATGTGGNDNWGGAAALTAAMNAVGAFAFSGPDSRDAATAFEATAGNNSVKVSAAGAGTGSVIAEIYDATPSGAFTTGTPRLINVSVLKQLGTGLTAGFTLGGATSKTVLIRAVGPTLGEAPFGVGGVVADPQLTLFAGPSRIDGNDNWGGTPALAAAFTQVGAFPLPASSRDAALVTTLRPGSYTVQVSGVGGGTGVALIEIYEVP